MAREEALKDFLRSLKVSLKKASIYFKDHPSFINSVAEVKKELDIVLDFFSPLIINFTPRALLIEGEYWEKEKIYEELAKTFHYRKVKSLQISQGVTLQELTAFILRANLPAQEILKEGGLQNILKKDNLPHITVDELDYSQLLKGKGEEVKDIWGYLLLEALAKEDNQKMNEIADNFDNFAWNFKTEDFLSNQELTENINKFFIYLKNKDRDKFKKCGRVMLKSFLQNKEIATETKIGKLKFLFKDLSEKDLASVLWDGLSTDDEFDSLSFNLFTQLTEKEKHKAIASSLSQMIRQEDFSRRLPQLGKKISELYSRSSDPFVSEIYRQTLSSLFKEIEFEEKLTIDRNLLQKNYSYLLLNLLNEEKRKERILSILEKILQEWVRMIRDKDIEYIKHLSQILKIKRKEIPYEQALIKIERNISSFTEKAVLEGSLSSEYETLIDNIRESTLTAETYLQKVFNEDKINPYILRLFFKLFPNYKPTFLANIKRRLSDSEFIELMIDNLQLVDSPSSLAALEFIFSLADSHLKIKVLQAVEQVYTYNEKFLLSILTKKEVALKKEALKILIKNKNTKEKALRSLFSIKSPLGFKNKILEDNIDLIKEFYLIEEATNYLLSLIKKRFFWNRNLRKKALQTLGKQNGK